MPMNMNGGRHEAENSKIEPSSSKLIIKDLCLRILLFLLSLTAMVVMVTTKQTKLVTTPLLPFPVSVTSKYTYFPSFIYFVVAQSLAMSYGFITSLVTLKVLMKSCSSKSLLKLYLVLIASDVVMVGVVAAAIGAATCDGYIGLRGNSKVGWKKLCNSFGKFCGQVEASIGLSLAVCVLLVVLVVRSACSVHRLVCKALN